jgi:SAM-dependent methyltransferase
MERHLPALLRRARALLKLPGGPALELSKAELSKAAAAVEKLHEGLIDDRPLARPETYEGPALGAYLLWWWPQTYAKTRAALRMLGETAPRRIVDAGAGPGPAASAALDALPGSSAVAFDASEEALDEARAIDPRIAVVRGDLQREAPQGQFDLLLAANVLSELPREKRLALLQAAPAAVLIEPALRETGRSLLQLRDELLTQGWFAVAPCLTQRPCPALVHAKDWCTMEDRWTPPPHVKQLADATGLRADELLSFALVIVARQAPPARPGLWRVVGVAPPEKGKSRVWVCGADERVAAVRLDRDASEANAAFAELRRGDLVQLETHERRGDGLRVGKDCRVERT